MPDSPKREDFFGGPAVIAVRALDPWLCVAGFRRFCLYRTIDFSPVDDF
jgi:hypothetical protein